MVTKKTRRVWPVELPDDLKNEWMTLEEACKLFERSRFMISRWCKEKILVRATFGRHTLISKASATKYHKHRRPRIETVKVGGKRRAKSAVSGVNTVEPKSAKRKATK
jgi:hypothetical protein